MAELQCPNCQRVITVKNVRKDVVCQKCLEEAGKSFTMVESNDGPTYKNLGDGLFEKR